jgi:hypothetical protein
MLYLLMRSGTSIPQERMTFQITSSTSGQIVATSYGSYNHLDTRIALVRASGTVTPYINGTSAGGAATVYNSNDNFNSPNNWCRFNWKRWFFFTWVH